LKNAAGLVAQGQAAKALAEIDQVVNYYDAFKEVPGAWWAQAALVKVSALAALHRDPEADALALEIQKAATDPETGLGIQVRLSAGLVRRKEFEKAIAVCDAAIKQSNDPAVLADAWLNKGHALFAQKQWDSALLAYLHVPVFYNDEKGAVPAALLGSAHAYWRLDDGAHARKSLNELIAAYPKSAEAAVAQSELPKMQTP
jgi:tetratricopeptide (TPR) repeat protein